MQNLKIWFEELKQIPKAVWLGAAIWSLFFTALGAWKYSALLYRDIDLAYFTQAIWNTAYLRPFFFTIHPTLTLGDHAEWIILPLAAIYRLIAHPAALLALQAIALASGAIAIFLIAKEKLARRWAIGVALAYLFLAVPMNAALFEFHPLAFALAALLFAALAFQKKSWRAFLICLFITLAIREDLAFAVIGFGAIAAIEKRNKKWIITPLAAGIAFFALDFFVIRYFAVGHAYKFGVYYEWLRATDVWGFLRHIFSIPVAELLIGLVMPFLFLPLVRPKWLLISALPLSLTALQSSGGGVLALQMHYGALLIPGFILSAVDGLAATQNSKIRFLPLTPFQGRDRVLLATILVIALFFGLWSLGPAAGIVSAAFRPAGAKPTAAHELSRQIPSAMSVAASDSLLPVLANRRELYELKLAILGVTQYAKTEYRLLPLPEYIALDTDEALKDSVQFETLFWTKPFKNSAPGRLRQILADGRYGVVWQKGPYLLWQKGAGAGSLTAIIGGANSSSTPTQVGNAKIYELKKTRDCGPDALCLALTLALDKDPGEDLALSLKIKDETGRLLTEEISLLGSQFFPTHEWRTGEMKTQKMELLGRGLGRATKIEIQLFRPRGALVMGPLRTSKLLLAKPEAHGVEMEITPFP
jgi:uncharacterized membrane protein